jgi:hypothetical protein
MATFLETTRQMLMVAFMGLPLMLIAFIFFMGLGLGNVGMIVLFLGQIAVVPTAVFLLQFITEKISPSLFQVPSHDICNLVPITGSFGLSNAGPSFWMAQVLFFSGYLLTNAALLYREAAQTDADPKKVSNRKSRAFTALITTAIVTLAFILIRYRVTGCETLFGTLLAISTMIPLGVGWYYFATVCGAKNADVFGIAAKMLPTGATQPPPMMCVYSA